MVAVAFCAFSPSRSQLAPQDQITWRTYKQGAFSNASQTLTNIFETEGQFQNFWNNVLSARNGPVPTQGVDWTKEKLVAINLGPRPNTGYELSVASIKRVTANDILVTFRERLPIEGVRYPQMQTSPWLILKMQRTPGSINFKSITVRGAIGQGGTTIIIPDDEDGCCEPGTRCCRACGCGCRGNHRGGG